MSKSKDTGPEVVQMRVVVAHGSYRRDEIAEVELDERNRALVTAGYMRPVWEGEAEAAAQGWPAGTLVREADPRPTAAATTRTTGTPAPATGG